MSSDTFTYDWADLAFSGKNPLKRRAATFIAAPRNISLGRLKQLLKQYLPAGDVILGIAKEPFVLGFEHQAQFKMLQQTDVQKLVDTTNGLSPKKVYVLNYSQKDLQYIIKPLKAQKTVFVRGSWARSFHTSPVFYTLVKHQLAYEFVSPFVDEQEAKDFASQTNTQHISQKQLDSLSTPDEFMAATLKVAHSSYDHAFQVGAIIAQKVGKQYKYVGHSHNCVAPYETYAMHHGFNFEENFSPPNDLNHFITVHAETQVLIDAHLPKQAEKKSYALFVNVMPCPPCARAISLSPIQDVYYWLDHSAGYALNLLAAASIETHRLQP